MARTAFFWDERCFWHSGGNYASVIPVGGLVQPMAAGGLPESPETKRRLKNLMDVTGLTATLDCASAPAATRDDLLRVHCESYLTEFHRLSAAGGGELGPRTPFGPGSYEIAAVSAGLVKAALLDVLAGRHQNAYALSRPPGHHCLSDQPMGFCLLNNIAVAIEAAIAAGAAKRFAVIDWDVHHGNGTEAIFLERNDVLTISLHQEHNYPWDSGATDVRGTGPGEGCNMNIPLPPGAGHEAYLHAFEHLVTPAVRAYAPDIIIVACGFDASEVDPLSRMMASAHTFEVMTRQAMTLADELCGGRIVMSHEGGYSEVHVPFCGHAVIAALADSSIDAPDPFHERIHAHQPNQRVTALHCELIDEMAAFFSAA